MSERREDRYFECSSAALPLARELYSQMAAFPILSPHGHVNAALLAENLPFQDPVSLLVTPDHYITRALSSQGIDYAELGTPTRDGVVANTVAPERIWQILAENWSAFAGTPSRIWFEEILSEIFAIELPFTKESAPRIYTEISEVLARNTFLPRTLFEQFQIESLATTDSTNDSLEHHKALGSTSLKGRVIPTFRPDDVSDPERPDWRGAIVNLEKTTNSSITSFVDFRNALRVARDKFIAVGAKATDHGVPTAFTIELGEREKEDLFRKARLEKLSSREAEIFRGAMLMEHAQMSVEDGLVMQLHPGSMRNYSTAIYQKYGPDRGFDIPTQMEFTNNLRPLLNKFGFEKSFKLALFTLDESTYSRELAPLAGAFPSVKLGPPWWFHDSLNGIRRWRDATVETAGYLNTIGFIDDTRAFLSIPVRHDVARRCEAGYLADLVLNHRVSEDDARYLADQIAYHLSKDFFNL
jgi:glucuronate isomerase